MIKVGLPYACVQMRCSLFMLMWHEHHELAGGLFGLSQGLGCLVRLLLWDCFQEQLCLMVPEVAMAAQSPIKSFLICLQLLSPSNTQRPRTCAPTRCSSRWIGSEGHEAKKAGREKEEE